ncbi:ribonuclease R [Methylophilus sp. 3sh_L]|uniref:ribonuclease R n=1 Tax=Methylophilus sp. 3sh_L TaxID=3377114 RepID=UPI00398EF4A2
MSTRKTKKSLRANDPQAQREAELYQTPLPSRELVLQLLSDQGIPLSAEQIYVMLDISHDERDIFNRRLGAMERDGQLMRNRKGAFCLPDKIHLIAGTVFGHTDGYGFLVPDDKTKNPEDIFLGPKEMTLVMHGDRAMVRLAGLDRRGRPEGKLVEVLERANKTLVGRVIRAQGVTIVAAEDKRISQDILIPYHLDMDAQVGQVVTVELTEYPSSHSNPMGKIVEILGNYADSGMEIEIALRKHHLPHQFNPAALKQAEDFPKTVQAKDYKGRKDLRELPLITIDGETARDFDDAVFAEPQGKGWRLVVAIADVSFYVQPGDALDKEAFDRGNSVYFPRRVIPMLPEALSNGLCSLNPDVERLCMVCDMQVDGQGVVKQYQFYPSVMRSKARMTYTKVAALLQDEDAALSEEYAWLLPHLQNLNSVFRLMLTQREKRGAVEFESTETMMVFNDNGKIDKIVPVVRNDAHKLIEECMLAANVCAADFLLKNEQTCLFRIHEGPTPEKLEALRLFMGEFGFGVGGGESPRAKDYAKLMQRIKARPDAQLLQTVMLRSMQQAVYSPDNVGHFGLAYEAYTHFTSPIRRYPDLLVHRAIKAVVEGKRYQAKDWHHLGVHCSMTERRADDATRDVTNWLKCFYMQDKVGEVFSGTVAGVTSFGLFVALDEVYVEGLLHVTDLGNDYFIHDKARHEMVGERTGVRYRLGDRLTVKVVRVDLETTRIDFTLVGKNEAADVSEGISAEAMATINASNSTSSNAKKTNATSKAKPVEDAAPRMWETPKATKQTAKKTSRSSAGSSRGSAEKPSASKAAPARSRSAKDKGRHSAQKNKGKPKARAR